MPEVKSARELAREIASSCLDFADPIMVVNTDRTSGIIQSDRRAIIEKCKEAIFHLLEIDSKEGYIIYKCQPISAKQFSAALDSVLFEIEKEE